MKVLRLKNIHFYSSKLVDFEISEGRLAMTIALYFSITDDFDFINNSRIEINFLFDDDFNSDLHKYKMFIKNTTKRLREICDENKIELEVLR